MRGSKGLGQEVSRYGTRGKFEESMVHKRRNDEARKRRNPP